MLELYEGLKTNQIKEFKDICTIAEEGVPSAASFLLYRLLGIAKEKNVYDGTNEPEQVITFDELNDIKIFAEENMMSLIDFKRAMTKLRNKGLVDDYFTVNDMNVEYAICIFPKEIIKRLQELKTESIH